MLLKRIFGESRLSLERGSGSDGEFELSSNILVKVSFVLRLVDFLLEWAEIWLIEDFERVLRYMCSETC